MGDWQPGDLALCIGRGGDAVFELQGIAPQAPGPIVGLTYTVLEVASGVDCYGRPGLALRFHEIRQRHPRGKGFNSIFFRKMEPGREAQGIEAEKRRPVKVSA